MGKGSLSREISMALGFKAIALALLYLMFFSGSRVAVTPSEMVAFFGESHSAAR
ncbi:MAG: phosphoglycerate mutase [Methylocystis sp.]